MRTASLVAVSLAVLSLAVVSLNACTSAVAEPPAAPAPAGVAALAGSWQNDRGSVLTLEAPRADGTFSGTFRSAVGNVDAARAFALTGVSNGDVVAFTVSFGAAGSVAAWTGQLTTKAGTDVLATQWHLSRNVADAEEATGLWSSTLTGADVFSRR